MTSKLKEKRAPNKTTFPRYNDSSPNPSDPNCRLKYGVKINGIDLAKTSAKKYKTRVFLISLFNQTSLQ